MLIFHMTKMANIVVMEIFITNCWSIEQFNHLYCLFNLIGFIIETSTALSIMHACVHLALVEIGLLKDWLAI